VPEPTAPVSPPQKPQRTWLDWIPLAFFLLALFAVGVIYWTLPGDTPTAALSRLTVVTGYVTLMLLFFFGLVVLFALVSGRIDLSQLVSEPGGGASMSRFQLLIFTFLIAFSLFLMVVSSKPPMQFPKVPAEILTLLGISASTYAVSKGIQASNPQTTKTAPGQTTTTVHDAATGQTTTTVQAAPAAKPLGSA
jgi:hypothetical protein